MFESKKQKLLIVNLVKALPDEYAFIKLQIENGRLWGFSSLDLYPGYSHIDISYPPSFEFLEAGLSSLGEYNDNDEVEDYKIEGLGVRLKKENTYLPITLLVYRKFLRAIKIEHADGSLKGIDVTNIKAGTINQTFFEFHKSAPNPTYENLSESVKDLLSHMNDTCDIFEIEMDGKTYTAFYDLEDGNYLAFDENEQVFSLVHDARPIVKKLDFTLQKILEEIDSGRFDTYQPR